MKCNYKEIFENKNRVMFVFAHPDDAELYSGGLIARLTNDKKEVSVVKVTGGDKGSRENIITQEELRSLRLQENKDSMEVLGVKEENNIYLNFEDGSVENNQETIEKLVYEIRLFKPDLIVSHNPEDVFIRYDKGENWVNHRDHRNTGMSVVDASYPYSRDLLFFPEHLKQQGVSSHKVSEYLFVDYFNHTDMVYFNVTKYFETKIKALNCHKSQFSLERANDIADFFAPETDSKRYEGFRHVIAD